MSALALEPLSTAQPHVYISGKSLLPMLHTRTHTHTHTHIYMLVFKTKILNLKKEQGLITTTKSKKTRSMQ